MNLERTILANQSAIDTADYGIPQHRKRLVTVLSRNEHAKKQYLKNGSFLFPEATQPWITLREAIGNLPSLRAEKGKNKATGYDGLHKVPLLDAKKLFWIDNTPEGASAFNNQCVNPACRFQGNKIHGASHDKNGINKLHKRILLFIVKNVVLSCPVPGLKTRKPVRKD